MRTILLLTTFILTGSIGWGSAKTKTSNSKDLTSSKSSASSAQTNSSDTTESSSPLNESLFKVFIRGTSNENQFSKSDIIQLRLSYFLKYYITPEIYLKANPIARLNAGHIQSLGGQDQLNNNFYVLNGAAYYEWMKESYAGVGIFDQYDYFSSLLVDDRIAFVGTQGKQSLSMGPWIFSILSQAVIPNTSGAISEQKEKESTPLLSSIGVSSKWKTSEKNKVDVELNYFKFSNVPTSVSTISVTEGNTPSDIRLSETERMFKYDYYGLDFDLNFRRRLVKSFFLLGNGAAVLNQGAPDGVNQANRYGGGFGFDIATKNEIEFFLSKFRIESDAVVGAYANTDYFKTNHNGYEMGGIWSNYKNNFRLLFIYTDAKLIVENPAQSDEKLFLIRFEVINVPI